MAVANNAIGGVGTGPGAQLICAKVLSDRGQGSTSAIAQGVIWSADRGADVINMSLGGPGSNTTMRNAIVYAQSRGAVSVCAAGNSNTSNPSYPAGYPECVGVAATTDSDGKASFSNFGSINVDIAAPGVSILATCRGGGHCRMSGTSMAAPNAAGVFALIMGASSPSEAMQTIFQTGKSRMCPARS